MARKTIAASGLREGDKIVSVSGESQENRRLVVTRTERVGMTKRNVRVLGTSRGGKEKVLFDNLMPNAKVVVSA